MSGTSIGANAFVRTASDLDRVWVLDDAADGMDSPAGGRAIGIAERLGVPFRRIPLAWNPLAPLSSAVGWMLPHGTLLGLSGTGAPQRLFEGLPRLAQRPRTPGAFNRGAGPALVISAGARSIPAALWLKARHGARLVHCGPRSLRAGAFDLRIVGLHEPAPVRRAVAILGVPHRASPLGMEAAAGGWSERLIHLPRPLVLVLTGGKGLKPASALGFGNRIAAIVRSAGGSVASVMGRGTDREAADALAVGLMTAINLVWRPDDPGPNPYLALLALADAVIVTGVSYSMLVEACASRAPVYLALEELAGARQLALQRSLLEAGQIRLFRGALDWWPRTALDETGRLGAEIARRFALETTG